MNSKMKAVPFAWASVCGLGLLSSFPQLAVAQDAANLLTNPAFADADGDKQPDKWKPNGTADGATFKVALAEPGTVQLMDADKENGVGLSQYVPVQAGHKYQLSAKVKGGGGLGMFLQFLDKIPGKEAMVRQHVLTDAHENTKASTDFAPLSVTLTAPANATQARVWFYCPKIGLTDTLVKEPVLTDLGAVAASEMPAAPAPKPAAAPRPAAGGGAPAMAAGAGTLANPEFADADGDGLPDGWRVFPSAEGEGAKISMAAGGGVQILDTDKTKGIGIQQQIPAVAGTPYTFTATLKGTQSISLNFQFLSGKPARDSEMKAMLLDAPRVFGTATPEGKDITLKATAPAGTTWMRIWLYSPNIGVTDVTVTKATLTAGTPVALAAQAPAAQPVVATPRPAGGAPAGGAPAGMTVNDGSLANPDMKDADGDGTPDGWRVFPDASGDVAKVSMVATGGVQIVDTDKTKGIGIQQQIPAVAGTPYTLTATLKGTQGISLNFQFLSGKPARDSEMKAMLLDTKRVFGAATPEGKDVTLTATAPAGTTWMRVWLYSPNIGVTDVTVTKCTLTSGALVAVAAVAPLTNPKLIFVGDFESGDYTGWETQFPHSTKGEIVTSPVRAGKYASKSTLTYADFKQYADSRNRRCEIYKQDIGKPGEERWYGFSVYLTKGFDDETFDIVMQIHNHPDPGEPAKSPILTLETHGKDWFVNDRWDKEKISKPGEHGSGGTITSNRLYQAPYEVEKWTDWVYHVKWSLGDDGLIEIFKDGEKVATYKGPNCYNDEKAFYLKMGVYKPAYRVTSLPERVIYHDELRIGNEKATYEDVAPPKK